MQTRLFRTSYSTVFKTFKERNSIASLSSLSEHSVIFSVPYFFFPLHSGQNLSVLIPTLGLSLPTTHVSEKPIAISLLSLCRWEWCLLSLHSFPSPSWASPTHVASPYTSAPALTLVGALLDSLHSSSWALIPVVAQSYAQHYRKGLERARWVTPVLSLAPGHAPAGAAPGPPSFTAVRTSCWLTYSVLPTSASRSFSEKQPHSQLVPSLYSCKGCPILQDLSFVIAKLITFLSACSSCLSRFLWKQVLPSRVLTGPPVSYPQTWWECTLPPPCPCQGHQTDTYGTLRNCPQVDHEPLTNKLWAWWSKQFLTHPTTHLSRHNSSGCKGAGGDCVESLAQVVAKDMQSCPSFTHPVISS